ncbi:MAG: HhH-GPD family protein [Xanthobacteraceae bacterium]|nr:HhH-GPD family protein [Xanthobacteraceae bacterium]
MTDNSRTTVIPGLVSGIHGLAHNRGWADKAEAVAEETLADQPAFDRALAQLVAIDPRLSPLLAISGSPALRQRPAGFAGLIRMVVAQQVSTASARAIYARFETQFDGAPTPGSVLSAGEDGLRAAGFSAPKIKTTLGIARLLDAGAVDLDALAALPSEEAREMLVRLPGIGTWTADVYLLFALGRSDAFPEGDLALQIAAADGFGLGARCHALGLNAIAEDWRPWRGVAAHVLWAYYAARRARQGAPA